MTIKEKGATKSNYSVHTVRSGSAWQRTVCGEITGLWAAGRKQPSGSSGGTAGVVWRLLPIVVTSCSGDCKLEYRERT